jgi:hemerythrin-like metal-binding protein
MSISVYKWTDELSVHIKSIDQQHQRLFELLDNFHRDINKQSPKLIMLGVIKALKDYTVMHFSEEEKLMKLYKYPDYEMHKKEHQTFTNKVLEYEERYKVGKMLLTVEVTNFIKDWIINHIKDTDQKYSSFFLKHGVK